LKENIDRLTDAFIRACIKYIISSKTFNISKKRPNAIEGAFYAKRKLCYILGGNNFQLKEA
jgi:hypothetical protein